MRRLFKEPLLHFVLAHDGESQQVCLRDDEFSPAALGVRPQISSLINAGHDERTMRVGHVATDDDFAFVKVYCKSAYRVAQENVRQAKWKLQRSIHYFRARTAVVLPSVGR
jgi:hypothetical protein